MLSNVNYWPSYALVDGLLESREGDLIGAGSKMIDPHVILAMPFIYVLKQLLGMTSIFIFYFVMK